MELMTLRNGQWYIETVSAEFKYETAHTSCEPAIHDLSTDEQEGFEERAAIMEFDGGLSKAEAEMAALEHILLKRRILD